MKRKIAAVALVAASTVSGVLGMGASAQAAPQAATLTPAITDASGDVSAASVDLTDLYLLKQPAAYSFVAKVRDLDSQDGHYTATLKSAKHTYVISTNANGKVTLATDGGPAKKTGGMSIAFFTTGPAVVMSIPLNAVVGKVTLVGATATLGDVTDVAGL